MRLVRHGLLSVALALACQSVCFAGNGSEPVGEPVVEPATLKCLGAYWVIKGDDNKNAQVNVAYRKVGTQEWLAGPPLFRVEKGACKDATIKLGSDDWLFAGSVIDVPEGTQYEMKLSLVDPDGGNAEKIVKAYTIAEPVDPQGPMYHVTPGTGGGTGTAADPFKGIAAAEKAAKPGDTFLLHAGTYEGKWDVQKSGEEGKPIVWKGAGDGEAIIEMNDSGHKEHMIDLSAGRHDVWFENLTTQGSNYSDFCLHNSYRIVIRRCHILPDLQGIYATKDSGKMGQFFISDNVIEGHWPWPATAEEWHSLPENRGVWIGGRGNVVCYNRVHNTKDGIDTSEAKGPAEVAVDFHNNEVYCCFDDGCEMDGSHRNCRNFYNRYTNTLTGISFQPVFGGPIYAYRNVCYNTKDEFLKLHNDPSGVVVVHNTFIHKGPGLSVSTKNGVSNCYTRNNLFVFTEGRALDLDMPTKDLDFDYDGFSGQSGQYFLRYNTKAGKFPFQTVEDVRKNSLIEKHLIVVDAANIFASGLKTPEYQPDWKKPEKPQATTGLKIYDSKIVDVRLDPKSKAVGAGEKLPGFNDVSKPVDLGAVPVGGEMPWYGPRPEKK
ncbi:MAG: right-handed parallel beta-helix repeat-containing protein [Phycisphaerales bacterium]|nr:right-handed parallel beta-helix repeat-containing protein [Phycisphaerales bacterium]